MRLLRVELSRFFSRRAIVLVLLGAALLTALVAGTTIWNTRPLAAADVAAARAQVQAEISRPGFQQELRTCQDHPRQYLGGQADAAACARALTPRPEFFLARESLSLDQERRTNAVAVVVLLAALMIVAGSTFAGSDWATGSISNQLLFEPRRTRVWAAKAAAALIGCLAAAAVLLAAYWLVLYAVAGARGIDTGATAQEQIRWMSARGVLLAGLGGLGGYALTMLLRHTVGALALLFAYAAGGEALLAIAPVDRPERFSPTTNVFAWLRDGIRVYDDQVRCAPGLVQCDQRFTVTLVHGATYLGVLLLLTLVVSALVFRRRDVP